MCSTSSTGVFSYNQPPSACTATTHVFEKGKPDCRCGAATRTACPECGREFETEE